MKQNKIPLTLTLLACFFLLAISAKYKSEAIPTGTGLTDGRIIVIDAGHGGLDSGCVGINGTLEKDVNLAIVLNLRDLLEEQGFTVILTRDEDVSIYDDGVVGTRNQKVSDMENRLDIVKTYPESVFLSIHQNQFTQSEYFGGQMFYTAINKDNMKLARIMQSCFAELQPGNDREIKLSDDGLYLFKETQQPALLIECGFLSNENDERNLSDVFYQKKVAFTIYKGLMQYYAQTEDVKTEESNAQSENSISMQ